MAGYVRVSLVVALIVASAGLMACESNSDSGESQGPQGTVSPLLKVASGKSLQVRSAIQEFMDRRLAGKGAGRFLDADGRQVFAAGGSLSPLYPKPALVDFKIVFVDDLDDGTYEVGVNLVFESGSYGDTLFVHRSNGQWVVSGGRPGLKGP